MLAVELEMAENQNPSQEKIVDTNLLGVVVRLAPCNSLNRSTREER
jgi:hypothetical protein